MSGDLDDRTILPSTAATPEVEQLFCHVGGRRRLLNTKLDAIGQGHLEAGRWNHPIP